MTLDAEGQSSDGGAKIRFFTFWPFETQLGAAVSCWRQDKRGEGNRLGNREKCTATRTERVSRQTNIRDTRRK